MKYYDKPVLSAESFERLLSAAYILQASNDHRQSLPATGVGRVHSVTAAGIIQPRTASLRIQHSRRKSFESRLEPAKLLSSLTGFVLSARHFAERSRILSSAALRGRVIMLSRPMFWRKAEAVAIGTIFCVMMGVSVHSVTSVRGNAITNASVSTTAADLTTVAPSISQGNAVALTLPHLKRQGEGDVVAEDIVIHHLRQALNLRKPSPAKGSSVQPAGSSSPPEAFQPPGVRLTFTQDTGMLAADTIVRYGTSSAVPIPQDRKESSSPHGFK